MILATHRPMTRVERVGLIAGLLLAAVLMWPIRGNITDATYVQLQYARHLANGQGLVFNPGERVYGCTSPLWVALLADAMTLGLDGLAVARALSVIAGLASVALFLQLMRRTLRSPELRALATVAWAGNAWMLRWSTSGLETSLAVALTLAGFAAFTEGRQVGSHPIRTGALWGLGALTRPELVLLLLLWSATLIVDAHNRDGLRRMVFGLLPPSLIYGLWLMFARVYFRTLWPQTLSAGNPGPTRLSDQLAHLWHQARIIGATEGALIGLLALALILGGRRTWAKPRLAQEVLPWMWVTALPLLYLSRGIDVISRYLLVLIPVLAWLSWRAAEAWWVGDDPTRARERPVTLAGAVACALVLAQNLTLFHTVVIPAVNSYSAGFRHSLVEWGEWFGRYSPPQAIIATPDIGALGYLSRRRVLDVGGQVTPQIVPYLEREPYETAVANFRFASFARPTFIVDRAPHADDLRKRSPFADCLIPLGTATVPNLGILRPGEVVYSFYRVDWSKYDPMRAPP